MATSCIIVISVLFFLVCVMSDDGAKMLSRLIVFILGMIPLGLIIAFLAIIFSAFS